MSPLGALEQRAHHHPDTREDPNADHEVASDLQDQHPLVVADHLRG